MDLVLGGGRREPHHGALALLLDAGANPNVRNDRKMTPLHRVAEREDITAAILLLKAGADTEAKDEYDATPLHRATTNDGHDFARVLLEAGADLDARDRDGNTPLHWAVRGGRGLTAELLLEAGADVNALNVSNQTPLHAAMRSRVEEPVTRLLERGADPNAQDVNGWSPLHTAAQYWFAATGSMMEALIEAGADVNVRAASGQTPLHLLAGQVDDLEHIRALLAGGAEINAPDTMGTTPLHLASAEINLTTVRALLDAGADVNARAEGGDTPLHRVGTSTRSRRSMGWPRTFNTPPKLGTGGRSEGFAVSERDTATVAMLVRAGADINARNDQGETALQSAARRRSIQLVNKLLELGALPEPGVAAMAQPTFPVCDWGNYDLFAVAPVGRLIECRTARMWFNSKTSRGETLLRTLVSQGDWNHHFLPDAIAVLLGAGADANVRDWRESTPLHDVAEGTSGSRVLPDAATVLLEGGAEVNVRDRVGITPLHVAAGVRFDNRATARVLVDAGADVNVRQDAGGTPLHSASGRSGDPAMIRFLVRAGADVNARDTSGETPLHIAVRAQNPAAAAQLLELEADPTLVDSSGTMANPASCEKWPSPMFFLHATAEIVARCIESGAEVEAKVQYDQVRNHSGMLVPYESDSTPLHVAAAWTRDPKVITLLVDAGLDVNERNLGHYTPLHYAARDNTEPSVIAELVVAGGDVEAWATGSVLRRGRTAKVDVTPLHEAARNEYPAIVLALLDAGANVNAVAAGGRMPLHDAAAHNPNSAVITALVSRGGEVNTPLPGGRTPLHEAAAKNRNSEIVTALLAAGAEVNAWGANDEVWSDRESMVAALRAVRGATPWGGAITLTENTGIRTPLHEAVMERGDAAVVAALIAGGADVNARGDLDYTYGPGATPLYWAVYGSPDPAVLELLVRAGADVNARARSGWTPLHLAALRNPVLFPTLLDLGADPDALDRYDKTPMDYAADNVWLEGWEFF
ncbi:MAG: hypothetical protein F4X05_01115 [Rhodothermaceae bacterium]|nr:hypothetical protein [Rhodothermaceae bacterium]